MSDPNGTNPPISGNKTITALLGVVAVLLVAIVAMIVLSSRTNTDIPVPGAGAQSNTSGVTTGQPGMGSSTSAPFDEKTATKVAAGQTPEGHVKAYYQAILDKKWQAAFKMQPAASQKGTVAEFQNTQEKMYGMTAFKILSAKTSGNEATVEASQDLGSNGTWGATWTFVKSGANWLVKERKVSMQ
jgi:hypothetical protein